MRVSQLLAKSAAKDKEVPRQSSTLPGHLEDVYLSAKTLLRCCGAAMLNAVLGSENEKCLTRT